MTKKKQKSLAIKINKKIANVMPLSRHSNRLIVNAVHPVYRSSMMNLLARHNNIHETGKKVKVDNTGCIKKDYKFKSFFVHIKDNKYKCLICNSFVIKDNNDLFCNPNNFPHRKQLKKGFFICNIIQNKVEKVNRIKRKVKYKVEDDTFMVVID